MTGVANHLVLFWIPVGGFPAIEILKLRAILRTPADTEQGGSELLIEKSVLAWHHYQVMPDSIELFQNEDIDQSRGVVLLILLFVS